MRNKLKFGDFVIIGVVLVMAGALAAALAFHSSATSCTLRSGRTIRSSSGYS